VLEQGGVAAAQLDESALSAKTFRATGGGGAWLSAEAAVAARH